MSKQLKYGVWPTMITPFTQEYKIDFNALEALAGWYKTMQVDGLFAVCQSSEMFELTIEERVQLAKTVKQSAGDDLGVIASGIIAETVEEQIEEVKKIAATGVQAVVLITNRFAKQNESDDVFKKNLEQLLTAIPNNITLGFYECPYPYKRLLSPELLEWCAKTNRFQFLKDTCCNLEEIKKKLGAVSGTPLKIYNANTETLLASLREGVVGYSGIMANIHADLYVRLLQYCRDGHADTAELNEFLSLTAFTERYSYPTCAKYYLQLCGVPIEVVSRTNRQTLNDYEYLYIQHLLAFTKQYQKRLGIPFVTDAD